MSLADKTLISGSLGPPNVGWYDQFCPSTAVVSAVLFRFWLEATNPSRNSCLRLPLLCGIPTFCSLSSLDARHLSAKLPPVVFPDIHDRHDTSDNHCVPLFRPTVLPVTTWRTPMTAGAAQISLYCKHCPSGYSLISLCPSLPYTSAVVNLICTPPHYHR